MELTSDSFATGNRGWLNLWFLTRWCELLPPGSEGHGRPGLFGDINKKQCRTLRDGDTMMKLDSRTGGELIYCAGM